MARRDMRFEMDLVDSSSDSGVAESVTDDDQQIDNNSLTCNTTAGIGVEDEISNNVAQAYSMIEEDFKAEWTDVLYIPMLVAVNPQRVQSDFMGQVHTWRGIDWSVLFRLHQNGAAHVGAYFGYDEQPYFLNDTHLRVQFQLNIVDTDDDVVLEGNDRSHSHNCGVHTFTLVHLLLHNV